MGTARRSTWAWAALAWAVAVLATAALLTGNHAARAQDADPEVLQRGGGVYQRWCATCHATDGEGSRDGPPLTGLGLAYLDLTMRTGRMPLADPERGVRQRHLSDEERELVNIYLADLLDLDDDIPDPPVGDQGRGQELYTIHCAACHGATGSGGVTGAGQLAPAVTGLDRIALAEAVRVGPFAMPPFPPETLSDRQLGDVVDYIHGIDSQPRTPLGMIELNRVTAAAFAAALLALLTMAAMAFSRWPAPDPPDGDDAKDAG